jgi:hypothetical protein
MMYLMEVCPQIIYSIAPTMPPIKDKGGTKVSNQSGPNRMNMIGQMK